MDLCVVQKHRDARPSGYVNKNKYLNYKCVWFFLTWDISGTIPISVKMFTAPACNKVWERHLNLQTSKYILKNEICPPLFIK